MSDFVGNLNIQNVIQTKRNEQTIDISFTIDGEEYTLRTLSEEGIFYPCYIYHNSNNRCVACLEKTAGKSTCYPFSFHRHDLFYLLIEHPSIRLEWLYIPHGSEE